MRILDTYLIYQDNGFRDVAMKKAFERSITTAGVIELIKKHEELKEAANSLWDSVTDCLNQSDIDKIERNHKSDLDKLGVI